MPQKLPSITEAVLPAQYVRSLVWCGDALVDWVGGEKTYYLNGASEGSRRIYAFGFDAAVATLDGEYAIIYTKNGTKGLVLKAGEILREIDRSYYCANAFEYPVALLRLENGRAVIAHCPDNYCQLELDDAETGERLTGGQDRNPQDFFHSRLMVSPDGQYLVSAGWVWHPIDHVRVFDVAQALMSAEHLDGGGLVDPLWADQSAASFLADGRLCVALKGDINGEGELNEIRRFDLAPGGVDQSIKMSVTPGAFMPIGDRYVLGFYEHPKLIDLASGTVVKAWPEIDTGTQFSSMVGNGDRALPAIAVDVVGRRCAIANKDTIFVLTFRLD